MVCVELQKIVMQLESELGRSHQKLNDLGKAISKLSNFKQMIVETLDVDDLTDIQRRASVQAMRAHCETERFA